MQLRRPCITCQQLTRPGRTRCDVCARIVRKPWDAGSKANRKARLATGTGAGSRLRYQVNNRGGSLCEACGGEFPASTIEIHHVIPLATPNGPGDVDDNVVTLCTGCHLKVTVAAQRRP